MVKSTHKRALDTAASQVLQSASSFLMTLGFAHFLLPEEFGILSGIWLVWMLVLSMNRSVFAEQLLAQGVGHRSKGYAEFSALWISSLLVVTVVVIVWMQAWSVLPGSVFVALFMAADSIRYWTMATGELRFFAVRTSLTALELVRFFLAAGFLWLSFRFPFVPGLAWTALLPGVVWLVPAMPGFRRLRYRHACTYLRRRGKFEAFMTTQFLTVTAVSQLLPMLALPGFGAAQFGGLRLTQSIVSPAALVGTAFQPALIALFAEKTARHQRVRLLLGAIASFSLFSGLIVAGGVLVVELTGHYWFPEGYRAAFDDLLLPSLVAIAFIVIGQPAGALLRVMRWGGLSLCGQAGGVAAGIILVLVVFGMEEASITQFAWALSGGQAVTVILTYTLIFLRLTRRSAAQLASRGASSGASARRSLVRSEEE
ncbi:hypothetical protein DXK94_21080 [Arthrobacter sp. RT-1]|uniref:hypothetical protein n=1 Tax=Arthrobacter sp. RT-1 TaxID=2292263 RepID=UPI000E1FA560|nr:hypothetical protein [Arthrobacter sp. RT-1]RDV08114.1 hypothetical protein DXK94_21080 [Arthrobacter sp. RT-1]